ncbi:ABC transporter substrate-binding protein [Deltaproteobacteria bacterium TL4]
MKQRVEQPRSKFIGYALLMWFLIILGAGLQGCDKTKKTIKVGFVGGLTGRLSDLGVAGRSGVMLAMDQVNAAGGIKGRPVELIVKDDKNDPEVAVQVDSELIREGVVAIIGHMISAMSIAALPLINKEKIVMLSPTSTANELTGLDDYFLRTGLPDVEQTRQLARYVFKARGVRQMAVVYELSNKAFAEGWYQNFKAEFENRGGQLTTPLTFTSGKVASYPGIAKELLHSTSDAVLIIAGSIDTAMICQELRKADSKLPVVSSGWAGTSELLQYGGSSVEGLLFPQTFDKEGTQENYLTFKNQFYERFKMDSNFASAGAYDAAQFIFSALAQTDVPENLKEVLLALKIHRGLQGEIRMDKYGDPERKTFLFTIRNGKFQTVE